MPLNLNGAELLTLGPAALNYCVPSLFAAMGGLISERSGVVNMTLEATLLITAFAGAALAYAGVPPVVTLGACACVGICVQLFYGFFVLVTKADGVVVGTALHFLIFALVPLFCELLYDVAAGTPPLNAHQRLNGQLGGLNFMAWAGMGLPFLLLFFLQKTKQGLLLRVAGENPLLLMAQNHSPRAYRWLSLVMGGVFMGLGGCHLAIGINAGFTKGMSAGQGFLGLAAVICGGWRPAHTFLFVFLFAAVDMAQMRMAQMEFSWGRVPQPLLVSLPFLCALGVLIVHGLMRYLKPDNKGNRSHMPNALGAPLP